MCLCALRVVLFWVTSASPPGSVEQKKRISPPVLQFPPGEYAFIKKTRLTPEGITKQHTLFMVPCSFSRGSNQIVTNPPPPCTTLPQFQGRACPSQQPTAMRKQKAGHRVIGRGLRRAEDCFVVTDDSVASTAVSHFVGNEMKDQSKPLNSSVTTKQSSARRRPRPITRWPASCYRIAVGCWEGHPRPSNWGRVVQGGGGLVTI